MKGGYMANSESEILPLNAKVVNGFSAGENWVQLLRSFSEKRTDINVPCIDWTSP